MQFNSTSRASPLCYDRDAGDRSHARRPRIPANAGHRSLRRRGDDGRSFSGCSSRSCWAICWPAWSLGPYVPDSASGRQRIPSQTLAELGVILLMFSLGIEFSLSKLLRVGPTAGFVAIVQCSLMLWLGYVAGQAFGWSQLASFYAGAVDRHLQHDDHRQGVRRAADQRRFHAHRVRHSDRRRPDRDSADHDSDDALVRRRADGAGSRPSGRPAGGVSWRS